MSLKKILPQVNRPSRYLGGELGSIKKDWDSVDVTISLAFPDTYEVGMSHLGFPILYTILNRQPWIAAERSYAPWPDMAGKMAEEGLPLPSLESEQPLGNFDILAFTLQYELSYSNVLGMLRQAAVPLRRSERDDTHPLVIVGGPCAFNPEPLADFIDAAVIGDGEEAVLEVCQAVREAKAAGESKAELYERLAAIEGVYIPSFFDVRYHDDGTIAEIIPLKKGYEKVRRRFLPDLDQAPYPTEPIVPFMNTIHNRVAVEIARGCTRGCRFCQAGYIYRPVRERSPETIARIIEESLENSGHEEVSLLSLSAGDYGCIDSLLKGLMDSYAEKRVAISLPSLRVGSLTPELMEEIRKVRKTGFTLAPEAGTERLRGVINKGITEEALIETTQNAFFLGWRIIKLYFMIGLPTETAEDLEGIIDLSSRVKRSGKGTQGGADVNVSVSTFVPKPHTPFQWEGQIDIDETLRRQQLLREGLKKKKLRLKWHEANLSFMEGVFARGDRRLGAALEEAVLRGCQFDGWREHFNHELWMEAFAHCGIDAGWYLRPRATSEMLPWDHLDCGIPKEFLLKERARAFEGTYTPDCRHGQCSGCGVCDFDQLRMRFAENNWQPIPPSETDQPESEADQRCKIRLRVQKDGKVCQIGHLEFMSVVQRAARRAHLPVHFSQGFHPAPRISFPDALPTGVASDAEIIDIEMTRPCRAEEALAALNARLPEGIVALEADSVDRTTPSPTACTNHVLYRVEIPEDLSVDLARNAETFLSADEIPAMRPKGNRSITVDLRPNVLDLQVQPGCMLLKLVKGSPMLVLSHLLGMPLEKVRNLDIRKTATALNHQTTEGQEASGN